LFAPRSSCRGRIISSPAVENGLVYVGSMDKNLYAVDQQTGALKWKFVSEGPVVASPALAGGIVYFASDDGKFYAIHAATGRLEWACETAGERRYAGRHLHVTSSGRDHAGPLELFSFFSRGVDGAVDFGSGDCDVDALDAVSGCLKWKFKTGDGAEIHNHVGIHP